MATEQSLDERVRASFRIICRKCGALDVHLNLTMPEHISDETGWQGGIFSIGCNGCGANDVFENLSVYN